MTRGTSVIFYLIGLTFTAGAVGAMHEGTLGCLTFGLGVIFISLFDQVIHR